MKVHETAKAFKPIHLILENQEEIDSICTLVNFVRITQIFPALDNWHNELEGYGDFDMNMEKLNKILRKNST